MPVMNSDLKQKNGFTLIELLVVILALSMLTMTAVARISQTDTQARITALQTFKSTLISTANLAKSVCLTDAHCNEQQPYGVSYATIAGQQIYFHLGYPVGWSSDPNRPGSLHQLIDPGRFKLQVQLSDAMQSIYYLEPAPDTAHCKLTYRLSASNTAPVLDISVEDSGC